MGGNPIPLFFRRNPLWRRQLNILLSFIITLSLSLLCGCATLPEETPKKTGSLSLAEISEGLPREGLWRQNIVLADMNGDGFLDIIAPPMRKAEKEDAPHIFIWNNSEKKWKGDSFTFPSMAGYGYGGVAAGDLFRDGGTDIVLGIHTGRIIPLKNDKSGRFIERAFPLKGVFYSRALEICDMNNDGWPDIVALSEASFSPAYQPKGVLIAINKEGKEWETKTLEETSGLFGDSIAVGDVDGDGNKDIIIVPLTAKKEKNSIVWFGDGKGNFRKYEGVLFGDSEMATSVRAGDIEGNGRDILVFRAGGIGTNSKVRLASFKWTGWGFEDISAGLEAATDPIVFDLADIDGDGKKELVVLSEQGIGIYKHLDKKWVEQGVNPVASPAETAGAFDLRAGRNSDGSLLIVYILGKADPSLNHGIRAYIKK